MNEVKCLIREANGQCIVAKRLIERDGDDVIVYGNAGYPTRMHVLTARAKLAGWNNLNGAAVELSGDANWQVLIPVAEARRVGLVA